jgi:hypothetical protein
MRVLGRRLEPLRDAMIVFVAEGVVEEVCSIGDSALQVR